MGTQQIFDVVENYLVNQKSNNALLITGEWGTGKTFFMKNQIKPKIQELAFDVLYISVNGINTIEQLKRTILSTAIEEKLKKDDGNEDNLWDKLKNKGVGGFSKILKAFNNAEAGSTLKSADKTGVSSLVYSTFVSMVEPLSYFDFEKMVLCFDDIERISSNLKVEDLFGFINTEFVEHKGYKVILIGDDTKNQLANDGFKKNKEKLIGWTIEYKPNLAETFHSIIDNYKTEKEFHSFLIRNKDFLIGAIQQIQALNLRSLLFFFDCLKRVISIEDRPIDEIIEKQIIYFTLVISSEYKKGSFPRKLDGNSNIKQKGRIVSFHSKDEAEKSLEKLYESEFEKFRNNTFLQNIGLEYYFFESIYDFICTGFLNAFILNKEITDLIEEKERLKLDMDEQLVNDLGGFPYLTNEELREKLKIAYRKVEEHSLSLYNFLLLCRNLFLLESYSLLEKSKEDLLGLFSENYFSVLQKHKYNINKESHIQRLLNEIKKVNVSLGDKFTTLYENRKNDNINQTNTAYLENWNIGHNSDIDFHELIGTVSYNKIAEKLIEKLEDRKYMSKVLLTIQRAYTFSNAGEFFYSDKKALENLSSEIKLLSDTKKIELIDKYIIIEILEAIDVAIKHLEITKK